MKSAAKSWIWFTGLMFLFLAAGIFVGQNRRKDPGKSFDYSLDDFRKVDAALIKYRELDPLTPDESIGKLKCIALFSDDRVLVGGEKGVQELSGKKPAEIKDAALTCMAVDDEDQVVFGWKNVVQDNGSGREWQIGNEKTYLTSVAVDEWYIYAADAGNRRIWRLNREKDAEPFEIGKKDWANGVRGFFIPSPYFDVAISPADGSFWAVNPGHHALENYRPDGMPLSSWEATGMHIEGFSGCCNPTHFALLPDGGFVTSEKGLPRVKIYNVDGSFRSVVAAPDQFDEEVTGLDLAVGDDGRIYVLDPGRNQVRIFEVNE